MIQIQSNFTDYYDCESTDSSIVYKRFRWDKTRGEELKILRDAGIKTIDIGTYRKFGHQANKKFVVYTDPLRHDFQGKHIYTYSDIINQYTNAIIAEFIENHNGYTVKYLQVGKKRYRLMMYNPNFKEKLEEGNVVQVEELPEQYNYILGLPIYSIDYISNGTEMLAVDFNNIQNLQTLDINKLLSPSEVVTEIEEALKAYNKV